MTQQSFRVSRNNSKAPKNKVIHSDVEAHKHRHNSFSIDYHNHESEDYTEVPDKRPSGSIISNKVPPVQKRTFKEDKRYLHTEKNEESQVDDTTTKPNLKTESNDKTRQAPFEPDKPRMRCETKSKEESSITASDHMQSRNQTDYLSNDAEDRQILIGFDLNLYTEAHKVLQQLQQKLTEGNCSSIVRKYLQIIATGALDDYSNINLNLHKRKIIKLSILYERISVLLVVFSQVTDNLSAHQNFLSNLLKYVLDNRILILTLLQNRLEKLDIDKIVVTLQSIKNNREARNFEIIRDNNEIIFQLIHRLSTEDNYFYQNLRKFIKGTCIYSIQQCFYFILEYFAFFLHLAGLQDRVPYLSVAPNPYLPPAEKYTLVFDFMEVMFNSKLNSFRPYSQLFIEEMSQFYELVSYSAVFPKEIQTLIKFVDRKNKIAYKLYKHHLVKYKSKYHKDLTRLGRPLSHVVLVDVEESQLNPKNCLKIKKWTGSNKDTTLADISQFLATISIKKLNAEEAVSQHNQQKEVRRRTKDKRGSK